MRGASEEKGIPGRGNARVEVRALRSEWSVQEDRVAETGNGSGRVRLFGAVCGWNIMVDFIL